MKHPSSPARPAPAHALQDYLDQLLRQATETVEAPDLAEPVAAVPERESPPLVRPVIDTRQPANPVARRAETSAEVLLETPPAAPVEAVLPGGRPEWGQRPFECLLFRVGGLALAVPLVALGTIYPLEARVTPLFGQPKWLLGLMPAGERQLRVVDTARLVMPERYRPELVEGYRYVIGLHGFDWGLAVDDVANAMTLEPDAVRWRSERSKRPWLAGTVVAQMCALLDVAALERGMR